jgi:predicted Zn-dependent protease
VSAVQADYFDGARSLRHPVTLLFSGPRLKLVGQEVDLEYDLASVRISRRVANTPRWVYLPGGGACVTADNAALDRYAGESALERRVHHWESRPAYAVLSLLLIAAVVWFFIDRGVPVVADKIAQRIPAAVESEFGRRTLQALDASVLKPSTLDADDQRALRESFAQLVALAGVRAGPLEFRDSPAIGPNAFALPSGIIVVTDQLVDLSDNDDEVLAVLAHELGHVYHRHIMRSILESSATGFIVTSLTGDITSASALAAAAPTILLQTKFSRDNEREADAYAIDLMPRAGIAPANFVHILQRLEEQAKGKGTALPGFLSSHPPTPEREALAAQAH